jgi:hypothetical protein
MLHAHGSHRELADCASVGDSSLLTYQVAGKGQFKPFFGLNGVHFTVKMYPTQAKLEWATLRAADGYAG